MFVSQFVFEEASAGDPKADAQHIAYAAIAGVDYVLTWNCRHLANAERLPGIYATLRSEGLSPPLIVTPEEFSDDE